MRTVDWIDENGFKRSRLLRDEDPIEQAEMLGIPLEPPDLCSLDWAEIIRDLHNELMDLGLTTWREVQRSQTGVSGAIVHVLKRKIIELYRRK